MEVSAYCDILEQQLSGWKAKLYDLTRKIDKMPSADKQRMLASVEDLHILVTEMSDRVDQLRNECPTEWSPVKKEIDDAHVDMRSKYEETMESIGQASPVSIPG